MVKIRVHYQLPLHAFARYTVLYWFVFRSLPWHFARFKAMPASWPAAKAARPML